MTKVRFIDTKSMSAKVLSNLIGNDELVITNQESNAAPSTSKGYFMSVQYSLVLYYLHFPQMPEPVRLDRG